MASEKLMYVIVSADGTVEVDSDGFGYVFSSREEAADFCRKPPNRPLWRERLSIAIVRVADKSLPQELTEEAPKDLGQPRNEETMAEVSSLQAFAAHANLTIHRPSPHHVQLRQDGKVFAEWWPGKGTTMMDGRRGPMIRTEKALIEWLKDQ